MTFGCSNAQDKERGEKSEHGEEEQTDVGRGTETAQTALPQSESPGPWFPLGFLVFRTTSH